MAVACVPKGLTYFGFIQDRLGAAQKVKPSQRCWGMMLSLAGLGHFYGGVYTKVAIHPGGFLDKVTPPDPDIPTSIAGVKFGQFW